MEPKDVSQIREKIITADCLSVLSKRVLLVLLERSHSLTKEVCFTLETGKEFNATQLESAVYGVDVAMGGRGGLRLFMHLLKLGSDFSFHAERTGTPTKSCTFWLDSCPESKTTETIVVSLTDLESIF